MCCTLAMLSYSHYCFCFYCFCFHSKPAPALEKDAAEENSGRKTINWGSTLLTDNIVKKRLVWKQCLGSERIIPLNHQYDPLEVCVCVCVCVSVWSFSFLICLGCFWASAERLCAPRDPQPISRCSPFRSPAPQRLIQKHKSVSFYPVYDTKLWYLMTWDENWLFHVCFDVPQRPHGSLWLRAEGS